MRVESRAKKSLPNLGAAILTAILFLNKLTRSLNDCRLSMFFALNVDQKLSIVKLKVIKMKNN